VGWIFKVVPAINPAGVAVLLIGENVRPALAVAHRTSAARRLAARPRGAGPEARGDPRRRRADVGL